MHYISLSPAEYEALFIFLILAIVYVVAKLCTIKKE